MNLFELRAVGWVVTRDMFVDIVRGMFGATPRIERDLLPGWMRQWFAVERALHDERAGSNFPIVGSFATPLSARSAGAFECFIKRIAAECPDRYGVAALRRRWRMTFTQATVGVAGCIALTQTELTPDTLLADTAVVLLAMGLWSFATAIQLAAMYRLVKRLHCGMQSPTQDSRGHSDGQDTRRA